MAGLLTGAGSRLVRVADSSTRALGMMQMLAAAYAEGETPWGPEREIVTRETAADAVVDVFATLHAFLDGEEVPPERLLATFTALMVIREWLPARPSERPRRLRPAVNVDRRRRGRNDH